MTLGGARPTPYAFRGEKSCQSVKVVELLAELEESWEDAAKQAVEEATKTIRGVRSVYISEFQATVENEKVKSFRINAKGVPFVLESGGQAS